VAQLVSAVLIDFGWSRQVIGFSQCKVPISNSEQNDVNTAQTIRDFALQYQDADDLDRSNLASIIHYLCTS
jgi:hypothetical protein